MDAEFTDDNLADSQTEYIQMQTQKSLSSHADYYHIALNAHPHYGDFDRFVFG